LPGIVGDQIELRAATPKGIAELPRVRVLIDSAIELLAAAGADVAPPG
jgi:hypothetical protein